MEEEFERDMTPKLVGETYMKYPTEKSRQKYRYGLYECQYCMNEFEANSYNIKRGHTKSCGCQHHKPREKSIKHGLHSNKPYLYFLLLFSVGYFLKGSPTNLGVISFSKSSSNYFFSLLLKSFNISFSNSYISTT